MSKKRKLSDMDITKVDLVDNPASPDAKILLYKHADGEPKEEDNSFLDLIKKGLETLGFKKEEKIEKSAEEEDNEVELSDEIIKAGKRLSAKSISSLETTIKQLQDLINSGKEETETEIELEKGGNNMAAKKWQEMSTDELKEYMGSLNPLEKAKLKEEMASLKKSLETFEQEDILKIEELPESIRKMVNDANAKAEEATKELNEIKKKAELEKHVEVAKSFDKLGIKHDEFGGILKSISETSEDAYNKIIDVLKAANEAVDPNIFKAIGSGQEEDTNGSSYEIMKKRSKEFAVEKNLTEEQAFAEFMRTEEGIKMYNEYLKGGN